MYMHICKNNAAEHNLQHNMAIATSVCQVEMQDVCFPCVFTNFFFCVSLRFAR